MTELHWDGGINHIEVQPLSPLTARNEMGETLDSVLFKLKKDTDEFKSYVAKENTNNRNAILKSYDIFENSRRDKSVEFNADVFANFERKQLTQKLSSLLSELLMR